MKERSLLLLRLSLGLLMVVWGLDKLVNVEHGMAVSAGFYLNLFSVPVLLQAFGVLQVLIGLLIGAGLARRFAYPALLAITATTALGVWKSIVDPWGWYLEGANVLFHPSLIIFAASLVLWAFRDEDSLSVDGRTRRSRVH
jgi:uncharacterized membrane protein YphA (DoxX/SURF4 family)